jgi:hypothetical protein
VKLFLTALLVVTVASLSSPAAHAQQFNHRITVYASVAQQRGIYVNSSGLITKIAGNTSNNVEPMVFNENNKIIAMTDSVQNQYQAFLKAHDYHLNAGETYYLNTASISNTADSRQIKIDTVGLTLGSG